MTTLRAGVILLTTALALHSVLAQTPAGALDVAVHDLQGKPIPHASLTLQAAGGKFTSRTAQTDDSGNAHFADLAPGAYRLIIDAKGFDELDTSIKVNPPQEGAPSSSVEAILT